MPEKFLLLDTETTGLASPRLVSLAYTVDGEQMINYGLFRPPATIEIGAMTINHITDEMVNNMPTFFDSPDFHKLQQLLDTHTLVAHNVSFDARVLINEGLRIGKTLCTKELAQRYISNAPNHQLQTLRYFLKLDCPAVAHNAYGDVIVLRSLFQKLKGLAPHLFPTAQAINSQQAIPV